MREPWKFLKDANRDGIFTISDVWVWLWDFVMLPGNSLIYWIITTLPEVGRFLEISESSYGGLISTSVSLIAWGLVVALIFIFRAFLLIREEQEWKERRRKLGYEEDV